MPSFDERAATWDSPDHLARAEVVAAAIARRLDVPRAARAIELGAGTGLLGLALADRLPGGLAELVLADPSSGMREVAETKIRDRGLAFARTIPFALTLDPLPPDEPFDLALSILVLHHVESTPAALGAMRGLLRPGGLLALADLDAEDGSFHDPGQGGIHHRGFDRRRLAAEAGAAGFRKVVVDTATEVEREGRRYPLFLLTGVAA